MKKKIILIVISLMLGTMCGCLQDVPLTDQEMDVVAEYAAGLLLKYDKNYTTALLDEDELEFLIASTDTPEPTPTEVPKEDMTPTENVDTTEQLTKVVGEEGFEIFYLDYEAKEEILSNKIFLLEAAEGKQFIKINFLIYNLTNQDRTFDASDNNLEYALTINVGEKDALVYKVSLSMLENDLQYRPIDVPANGVVEAVLLFEVAETEINTLNLIMENASEDAVFIKMK